MVDGLLGPWALYVLLRIECFRLSLSHQASHCEPAAELRSSGLPRVATGCHLRLLRRSKRGHRLPWLAWTATGCHGGPGGPLGFSRLGKNPVKPSPGRVWGDIGTPKRFLGAMETIPLLKNPVKPRGGPNPPQKHVFQAPMFGPKRGPGPSGTQTWTWGSQNEARVEHIKVAG